MIIFKFKINSSVNIPFNKIGKEKLDLKRICYKHSIDDEIIQKQKKNGYFIVHKIVPCCVLLVWYIENDEILE